MIAVLWYTDRKCLYCDMCKLRFLQRRRK